MISMIIVAIALFQANILNLTWFCILLGLQIFNIITTVIKELK